MVRRPAGADDHVPEPGLPASWPTSNCGSEPAGRGGGPARAGGRGDHRRDAEGVVRLRPPLGLDDEAVDDARRRRVGIGAPRRARPGRPCSGAARPRRRRARPVRPRRLGGARRRAPPAAWPVPSPRWTASDLTFASVVPELRRVDRDRARPVRAALPRAGAGREPAARRGPLPRLPLRLVGGRGPRPATRPAGGRTSSCCATSWRIARSSTWWS